MNTTSYLHRQLIGTVSDRYFTHHVFGFIHTYRHNINIIRKHTFIKHLFIMNTLRNSVQLTGNIGSELKLSKTKSGASILKFSLATNDYYVTSKGERTKETQWHRIVAWGKQAELMSELLYKGCQMQLRGKLTYNSFEGEDGNMRYFTEIRVVEFMKITKEVVEREEAPF